MHTPVPEARPVCDPTAKKQADMLKRLGKADEHAGLLAKRPPGKAELSFIKSSNDFQVTLGLMRGAKARVIFAHSGSSFCKVDPHSGEPRSIRHTIQRAS